MTFGEAWVEHDYNPFILFNEDGRVKSLNKEAQYLLAETKNRELFDLTQIYASHSYGFKTTIINLSFGSYRFYAITVGYLDENEIGIKLYKTEAKKFTNIENQGDSVSLYVLLDLCISASSTRSKAKFTKDFDPTFPDIKLQISNFTKLLDKIYQSHSMATFIKTKLSLVTGEHIRQNAKKYPIFSIRIASDYRNSDYEKDIDFIAQKSNATIRFKENSTVINSALICDKES